MFQPWAQAWQQALYGPHGYYRHTQPAAHFSTSVSLLRRTMSSGLHSGSGSQPTGNIATAMAQLASHCQLPRIVDIGCGEGDLLASLTLTHPQLATTGIEVRPRPTELPASIDWRISPGGAELPARGELPEGSLVIAHEWLDDIPVPIVQRAAPNQPWQLVEVDPRGTERLAGPPTAADQDWLARWWPHGIRAEVGRPRDMVWQQLLRSNSGRDHVFLAIDYSHSAADRPQAGSLAGYRNGRRCAPRPDAQHNITAAVALDAVAAAGVAAGAISQWLLPQRIALAALGVSAQRPPVSLARTDPARYVAGLQAAGAAAELLDPHGLGALNWLIQVPDGPAAPRISAALGNLLGNVGALA